MSLKSPNTDEEPDTFTLNKSLNVSVEFVKNKLRSAFRCKYHCVCPCLTFDTTKGGQREVKINMATPSRKVKASV